jgi:hypothetical protein
VTRRFRIGEGNHRWSVAFVAAAFGTLLGMTLLFETDMTTTRNYWFSALSGMMPALIIASASLRRRMWRRRDSLALSLRRYAPVSQRETT